MHTLTIFLDDYKKPIIIPLVSKINHEVVNGDKIITFEYLSFPGSSDTRIHNGVFFINKIKGYTID